MCGLAGVAGIVDFKSDKMFSTLLFLNQLRGTDSTGVAAVRTSGVSTVYKTILHAQDFMDTRGYDAILKGSNRILMGHCRAATKGAVTKANAHPFEFEHIIGAHNGTLNSQFGLKDYLDFKVDSENIYHHMNTEGAEDTWSKLNGAAALTWINKDDGSLHFLRNDKREFHYAFSKDRKQIFWSSEKWMLIVAAMKSGVELDGIVETPVNMLHTITFNKQGEPQLETKELEPYKWVAKTTTGGNWSTGSYQTKKPNGAENLKEGDVVRFEVTRIDDVDYNGIKYCNIKGCTYDGIPIIIYNMPMSTKAKQIENLQLSVNMFQAQILSFNQDQLVLMQNSIQEEDANGRVPDDSVLLYCDYCYQECAGGAHETKVIRGKSYILCESCAAARNVVTH